MLCSHCEGLHFRSHSPALPATELYYALHGSPESLNRSVREECHLCILIYSKLDRCVSRSHVCGVLDAYVVLACSSTCNSDRLRSISIHSRRGFHRLDVLDPPSEVSPASYPIQCPRCAGRRALTRSIPGTSEGATPEKRRKTSYNGSPSQVERSRTCEHDFLTGSPSNLAMAKSWLSECLAHHEICGQVQPSSDDTFLPTRLIQIDPGSTPRLVDTNPDTKGPYVALSYSWGSGRRLITSMALVDAWRQRLPMDILPLTFIDSIVVAEALGFRYLWIDALCIIQDDLDDVSREIPKMGDIYRHAQMTIDVAGAESCCFGAFAERDPLAYRPCQVPVTITTGNETTSRTLRLSIKRPETNHLDSRGWVLQERVLSNRRLVFGQEMGWKCSSHHARESDPWMREHGDLANRTIFSPVMMRASLHMHDSPSLRFESAIGPYRAWYSMVESYSDKLLTFPSDNLQAISGLAFLFQQKHGAPYLAGLWEDGDLRRGLAWYVGLNDRRPVNCVSDGPSWSWSSVGKVRVRFRSWSGDTWQPVPGEGASILPTGAPGNNAMNPYQPVTNWPIKLRTRIKKAAMFLSPEYVRFRTEGSFGATLDTRYHLDPRLIDKREHARFPALVFDLGDQDNSKPIAEAAVDRMWSPVQLGPDGVAQTVSRPEYWCALLHVEQLEGKYHGSMMILVKGSRDGVFRRLGIAFLSTENIGWIMPLDNEENGQVGDMGVVTIE